MVYIPIASAAHALLCLTLEDEVIQSLVAELGFNVQAGLGRFGASPW